MSIDTYPPIDTTLILPLSIANGGTGGDDAAEARSNLGLGTMSTQNANAVEITGGSVSGLTDAHCGVLAIEWQGSPLHGIYINDGPAGARNGILGLINAGTDRYNLNLQGNAPNYLRGNLGIGRLPISGTLELAFVAGQSAIVIYPGSAGQVFPIYFFNASQVNVGSISTTDTGTAYNTSSDSRLKHAIENLVGSLDTINMLNPVRFLWNADNSHGEGFLAHELQQVMPLAVTGDPDALNDDGTIDPQQVDYSKLVPRLVGAIQELLERIEVLEARLV